MWNSLHALAVQHRKCKVTIAPRLSVNSSSKGASKQQLAQQHSVLSKMLTNHSNVPEIKLYILTSSLFVPSLYKKHSPL